MLTGDEDMDTGMSYNIDIAVWLTHLQTQVIRARLDDELVVCLGLHTLCSLLPKVKTKVWLQVCVCATQIKPLTDANVDTSRRSAPARRKRSRSASSVPADTSDVEEQPALKSAMKRPRKLQRVIRPVIRPQKQQRGVKRGKGKARAASVVSGAETDDNVMDGPATDVDTVAEEMIAEDDWHVGPTASVSPTHSCSIYIGVLK